MADASDVVLADSDDTETSSRGHRQLDDVWEHYKKIRLTQEGHDKWHRWFDARCKYCGDRFAGKPAGLRKHTVKCKKADLGATKPVAAQKQQLQLHLLPCRLLTLKTSLS